MTNENKLSNKELVDELLEYTPQVAQCIRCEELSKEILRRLNESWRAMKESVSVELHKKEISKLAKGFYEELDDLNYQQSIRHQINNIQSKLERKMGKKKGDELDWREYYG